METLREQLIRHEGLMLEPYYCPAGYYTIGVGRNLDANGISEDEAMFMLDNDLREIGRELGEKHPIVHTLDEQRYNVLLNMAFNMGVPRLSGFKRMWAAIEVANYELAAEEMLDSRWSHQVGKRAIELSWQMKNGRHALV